MGKRKKVVVRVINDILGNSIFWSGKPENIKDIKNYPAMTLAKKVVVDGKAQRTGMWYVTME